MHRGEGIAESIQDLPCCYNYFLLTILFMFFFIIYVFLNLILLIYFWLHWAFITVHRLSLVAVSRGYSSLQCTGFSLQWLLLWSAGSRCPGSRSCDARAQQLWCMGLVALWHVGSSSLVQGLNPCPLYWQANSCPLYHQGSPCCSYYLLLGFYLQLDLWEYRKYVHLKNYSF